MFLAHVPYHGPFILRVEVAFITIYNVYRLFNSLDSFTISISFALSKEETTMATISSIFVLVMASNLFFMISILFPFVGSYFSFGSFQPEYLVFLDYDFGSLNLLDFLGVCKHTL